MQRQLRMKTLTSVMCVDGDVHQRSRCHAQRRDSVHGLYVKSVASVHLKV